MNPLTFYARETYREGRGRTVADKSGFPRYYPLSDDPQTLVSMCYNDGFPPEGMSGQIELNWYSCSIRGYTLVDRILP